MSTNKSAARAGDAQFFDTSRALGVIGIVAAQSIEAYIAAIGNEHATSALLGNFTNVVAFRSTERTMEYVAGKLGDVDVWKETYNTGRSDQPTIFFPKAASVSPKTLRLPAAAAAPHRANVSGPRPRPSRRVAHRRRRRVRRRVLCRATHRRRPRELRLVVEEPQ